MPEKKLFGLDKHGQLSIDGLMGGFIVAIIYLILAALLFPPIYAAMAPFITGCVPSTYGSLALTIILIAVYIIMPVLIIATFVSLSQQRVTYTQ